MFKMYIHCIKNYSKKYSGKFANTTRENAKFVGASRTVHCIVALCARFCEVA